jgi:diacylglycerol kinase
MYQPPKRSWPKRFSDAGRGLWIAVRGGGSYTVHLFTTVAVVAAAAFFRVSPTEWCLLILCIALVFAAEIQNTGLEVLAKAVRQEYDPIVRDALDIGSGAVLAAAIGSVVVGLMIFLPYIWKLLV